MTMEGVLLEPDEEHFTSSGEACQSFSGEWVRVPVGKVGSAERNSMGLHDVLVTYRQFPVAEVGVA